MEFRTLDGRIVVPGDCVTTLSKLPGIVVWVNEPGRYAAVWLHHLKTWKQEYIPNLRVERLRISAIAITQSA